MVFKERKTFYSLLEVLELLENVLYLVLKQVKIHGKMLKNTDKESFGKEDNIEHLSSYFLKYSSRMRVE